MLNFWKQLTLSDAVALQFIRHDHARGILKALQQPSKEALRGFGVPPRLNEDVEHDPVLIHGAPKIVLHALDPDEHLIKVPLVTGSRTTAAQAVGEGLGEFLAPAPNGFVGDDDTPLGQSATSAFSFASILPACSYDNALCRLVGVYFGAIQCDGAHSEHAHLARQQQHFDEQRLDLGRNRRRNVAMVS